jgi:hypothetical protein
MCSFINHANIENRWNREIREIRESRFLFVYFACFAVKTIFLGEDLGAAKLVDFGGAFATMSHHQL